MDKKERDTRNELSRENLISISNKEREKMFWVKQLSLKSDKKCKVISSLFLLPGQSGRVVGASENLVLKNKATGFDWIHIIDTFLGNNFFQP